MTFQRRCLTLIETMVVIALLGLLAGAVGWNVYRAISEQSFYNEVQLIVNRMRFAQDLMLITDADVELRFYREDGVTLMETRIIGEVSPILQSNYEGVERLPAITYFQFDPGPNSIETEVRNNEVLLHFLARGQESTSGHLELANNGQGSGGDRRYILLTGYPSEIESTTRPDHLRRLDGPGPQENERAVPL